MSVINNINYKNCITNLTSSIQKHFGIKPNYSTNPIIDNLLLEKDYQNVIVFVFDGMGGVKVTFTCTDNYSYCSATYTSNSATYTFVDGVVTIVSNSKTMVFSVNDAANPTSLTCTSTSVSSSDDGYFATGSIFEC